jgi:hypothetical protein
MSSLLGAYKCACVFPVIDKIVFWYPKPHPLRSYCYHCLALYRLFFDIYWSWNALRGVLMHSAVFVISRIESDEELARRLQAELDRADEEQQRQDELLAWQLSQQLQQPPTGPAAPYNDKRHYDNRMVLAEATLTNLDQPSTTNNGQSSPSSTGIPTPLLSSTVLVPTNQSVLATGDTSSKDDTAFLDEDPFGFGPNSIFQLNGETRARELQEQRDLELARQLEEEFKAESRRRQDQGRQHGGSQSNGLGSRGKRQPASSFNSISEADLARPFQSAGTCA